MSQTSRKAKFWLIVVGAAVFSVEKTAGWRDFER
jgi:hypothetical protein